MVFKSQYTITIYIHQTSPSPLNTLLILNFFNMSSLLSEIEPMDDLPFIPNPNSTQTTSTTTDTKPKLVAPSIDEVDEDPELLRTLRGEGRYFGIGNTDIDSDKGFLKETAPKCSNCSHRGHLKRNCPHVICTYCGMMDDHYSQHCPTTIRCSNCNETGHYRYKCPYKWKKTYCTLCNSKRHSRDRCPSIWRVYLLKDTDSSKGKDNFPRLDFNRIFCYNCGTSGHFGDECPERRSSKVPNDDGSAFSGENLPSALKKVYFDHLRKEIEAEADARAEDRVLERAGERIRREGGNSKHSRFNNKSAKGGNNSSNNKRVASMYDDGDGDDGNYHKNKKGRNSGSSNSSYLNYDDYGSYSDSSINPRDRNSRKQRRIANNSNGRGQQQPPPRARNHPLDFPRSNLNYSNNGYNRNSESNHGFRRYKPSRSGVLRR